MALISKIKLNGRQDDKSIQYPYLTIREVELKAPCLIKITN
jgi:hypothetical protein